MSVKKCETCIHDKENISLCGENCANCSEPGHWFKNWEPIDGKTCYNCGSNLKENGFWMCQDYECDDNRSNWKPIILLDKMKG